MKTIFRKVVETSASNREIVINSWVTFFYSMIKRHKIHVTNLRQHIEHHVGPTVAGGNPEPLYKEIEDKVKEKLKNDP